MTKTRRHHRRPGGPPTASMVAPFQVRMCACQSCKTQYHIYICPSSLSVTQLASSADPWESSFQRQDLAQPALDPFALDIGDTAPVLDSQPIALAPHVSQQSAFELPTPASPPSFKSELNHFETPPSTLSSVTCKLPAAPARKKNRGSFSTAEAPSTPSPLRPVQRKMQQQHQRQQRTFAPPEVCRGPLNTISNWPCPHRHMFLLRTPPGRL